MKNDLAIVIPAYRSRFLARALDSLAGQTDKRFSVYVGDDASPENLESIVQSFTDRIDIHYTRFEENFGGKDLVAQWTRCVSLASEEWIWLFSDDDEMERGCVAAFHAAEKYGNLFHFNVNVIDSEDRILENCTFPESLSARSFANLRFRGRIRSYAVEYVFRKDALDSVGGFVNFDMAWCSDDATWISLAMKNGICSISGPRVRWRRSGANITSDTTSSATVHRKMEASLAYEKWIATNHLKTPWMIMWFVTSLYGFRKALSDEEISSYMERFASVYATPFCLLAERLFYRIKTMKRGK